MIREKCGVFGIHSSEDKDISKVIIQGLIALQHRGQEGCGISISDGKKIVTFKSSGLVTHALGNGIVRKLVGRAGIGHVRYSTTGSGDINELQPFVIDVNGKRFSIAWNGTLTNFHELRQELINNGFRFITNTDTEVLAKLIALYYLETRDFMEAISRSMDILEGSFSAVLINDDGELYAFRDKMGIKPLTYGFLEDQMVVASESIAIESVGGVFQGDVKSGEILRVSDGGIERKRKHSNDREAYCMFEYVYFSRPDSIINGISVYNARYRLGKILAELYPVDADVVVPIPDTGTIAALGYSDQSGVPISLGLIRNPYVGRTFIKPDQKVRELSVSLKLGPVRSQIKGKKVILIDDSIVRGTTMRNVIGLLRRIGAREMHVRVTSPPIKYPCFLGIDFPTRRELIASHKSVEEIRKIIGADSLGYMTIDGLVNGIGTDKLCLACLMGKYPIKNVCLNRLEKIFEVMRR